MEVRQSQQHCRVVRAWASVSECQADWGTSSDFPIFTHRHVAKWLHISASTFSSAILGQQQESLSQMTFLSNKWVTVCEYLTWCLAGRNYPVCVCSYAHCLIGQYVCWKCPAVEFVSHHNLANLLHLYQVFDLLPVSPVVGFRCSPGCGKTAGIASRPAIWWCATPAQDFF